jgi:hypothetical protein
MSNRAAIGIGVAGVLATVAAAALGSYLTDYYSRAKPAIVVTSVGFGGPLFDQAISLSDEVITLSSQMLFVPTLKRFENFAKLLKYDTNLSEKMQTVRNDINAIQSWQKQYADMTYEALSQHPIVNEETVAEALLHSSSKRHQGELPPIPTAELDNQKRLFGGGKSTEDHNVVWHIEKPQGEMTFGYRDYVQEDHRNLIDALALSILVVGVDGPRRHQCARMRSCE